MGAPYTGGVPPISTGGMLSAAKQGAEISRNAVPRSHLIIRTLSRAATSHLVRPPAYARLLGCKRRLIKARIAFSRVSGFVGEQIIARRRSSWRMPSRLHDLFRDKPCRFAQSRSDICRRKQMRSDPIPGLFLLSGTAIKAWSQPNHSQPPHLNIALVGYAVARGPMPMLAASLSSRAAPQGGAFGLLINGAFQLLWVSSRREPIHSQGEIAELRPKVD